MLRQWLRRTHGGAFVDSDDEVDEMLMLEYTPSALEAAASAGHIKVRKREMKSSFPPL